MNEGDASQQNRRVVVAGAEAITVEREPAGSPGSGEVLVASTRVGICGSDTHAARGEHPFIDLPYQPGHEVVGVVREVGEGVSADLVGRRVVVEPNLPCGRCELCAEGRYNICEELLVFGCQTPGGLTDTFVIARDRVLELPDDLDDDWAVLIEPMATPVRAVRALGDLTGRRVAVLGAGPIGLFTALAARSAGAATVAVGDLLESKRERAARIVADATFDPGSGDAAEQIRRALGGPPHAVCDCVSVASTVALGIASLEKGGILLTIGVPRGEVPIDLSLVQDRELRVQGSLMYVREDIEAAIDILAGRPFPLEEIITSTFPLDETAAAFEAAADPEQFKVVVAI